MFDVTPKTTLLRYLDRESVSICPQAESIHNFTSHHNITFPSVYETDESLFEHF